MSRIRDSIRRTRRRVREAEITKDAVTLPSRAVLHTLSPSDHTLAAVVRALRFPCEGEESWVHVIEPIRSRLESSDESLSFSIPNRDWWARAIATTTDPQPPVLDGDRLTRRLAEITRVTSKPPAWGRFLYRVVRELRAERCLELGTSVGMSGSYIAAGLVANGHGRLITIEGAEPSAGVAREVFAQAQVASRAEVRTGQFADEIPAALETLSMVDLAFIDGHHQFKPTLRYFGLVSERISPGGLPIFDDVNYDLGDMAAAWRKIRAHPRVTGSLTVGGVGFAVIEGTSVRHRRVRRLTVTR
jgi:predicted O-methyltransferase YrrM